MKKLTGDEKHEILEDFYVEFSKLIASLLDKCDDPDDVHELQWRMQEKASVYGSNWEKYSKKFRIKTIQELRKNGIQD